MAERTFDVKQMERDILEASNTLGAIGYFNGSHSTASQVLIEKYGSREEDRQLTTVLDYLVEERYLFPFCDSKTGEVLNGYARGITPKGYRRLQELQHPIRTWVGANWFAVFVAGVTTAIGVASVVVNLIVNSD